MQIYPDIFLFFLLFCYFYVQFLRPFVHFAHIRCAFCVSLRVYIPIAVIV